MNTTAQKSTDLSVSASPVQPDTLAPVQQFPLAERDDAEQAALSAEELRTIKDEKLSAIRRALEKGDYDSDEILEKALDRMLERLEEADSEQ